MNGDVIQGPWPTATKHVPPLPHRRLDKWGGWVLTACKDCETPFRTDEPIPADQLCVPCRAERRAAEPPSLFE